MAQTKNLCAQISLDLHQKICEAREQSGLTTAQYITALLTDRVELASLLNISENQLSYITNVDAGRGLIKCGSAIVPFVNSFPKNTRLYKLMTTKPSETMAK